MRFKRKHLGALTTVAVATAAVAATIITVNTPIALSDGVSGDKPKIQRAGDGRLVVVYGDNTDDTTMVYDVKANKERLSRDIFVKTCMPDATKTCDNKTDWSASINISNSATKQSTGTFDWRGTLGDATTYPGDIDKPNIKTSGPVMVVTWVSKYCPDGDLVASDLQPSVQRGVQYMERDGGRVIPFSCAWTAYSTNNGVSWKPAIQLSTGERDAIQDSSGGGFNSETKKGQVVISWQEDPRGLLLGEADGPGDGASGANVSNGTDVWYTSATIDLSDNSATPPVTSNDFVLAKAVRLTDNVTPPSAEGGGSGETNAVFGGNGVEILASTIETGSVGASRPNIGIISNQAIVTYEETKGSSGADKGKFIRYHSFTYNKPEQIPDDATSNDPKGCIISDPARNARRVRFLTQSPADAGANGIQLAIFWKEGLDNKGGASDIVVRRAGGTDAATVAVKPANMVPTVSAACATSDYTVASGLGSNRAQNISSRSADLTSPQDGLTDDTEGVNANENALAHRGVLRGKDLWIGYSYVKDLDGMTTQTDNYNFWMRKFNADTNSWNLPKNLTNITDKRINVREPRIFGTPKSGATCPTDPTNCQNADVVNLAWGTQENKVDGDDLSIYITQSNDSGVTFATPVRYSTAKGSLFQDEESAYEAQIVSRPDGTRFYGVWNQADAATGNTVAEYASGSSAVVADPVTPATGGGGGCTAAPGQAPFDPVLPLLAALGLAGWGLRRARHS